MGKMNLEQFSVAMTSVFAAFQKTARKDVLAEIYARVENYSDSFLEYATAKLKDLDKLPQNVGRELVLLYPDYLAETFGDACLQADCPDCGGSGWIRLGRPDATSGSSKTCVPCTCNTVAVAMFPGLPVRTRSLDALLREGWHLKPPAPFRAGERADATVLRRHVQAKVDRLLEEFRRLPQNQLADDPMEGEA